jgi:hypothetical protein
MKTSALLLASVLILAACKKENVVTPGSNPVTPTKTTQPTTTSTTTTTTTTTTTSTPPADTLANLSAIKISLVTDSTNYDETMFLFRKTATVAFDPSMDGQYLQGYGLESLASVAPDGTDMAIYSVPYTPNMSVKLDVHTKNDGQFLFKMSYARTLPANLQVWIKDSYAKDSLNVRTGNYKFNVIKADTASYGSHRFRMVLKRSN